MTGANDKKLFLNLIIIYLKFYQNTYIASSALTTISKIIPLSLETDEGN